jgi:predicted Zn finger-like uncharacterized protein
MSLATRCTSCGTVFRVVQDQLKVSEGWVRCGRCDEVFNALEGLFDLGRDSPPEWSGDDRAPADVDIDVDDHSPASPIAPSGASPGASPVLAPPSPPLSSSLSPSAAALTVPPAAGDERGHSSSFPSTAPAAFEDLLAADPIDAHLFRNRGHVADPDGHAWEIAWNPAWAIDEKGLVTFGV